MPAPLVKARALLAGAVTMVLVATCARENLGPVLPMSLDAGPDTRAYPGESVRLALQLADSGGMSVGPWSYAIAWGDGSEGTGEVDSLGRLLTSSHAYATPGQYALRVTATNSRGGAATDTLTAFIDPPGTPQVLVGAGDIGECGLTHAAATADILDTVPGTVFTLGDNAYPNGALIDYASCYAPYWGRHRKRTYPTPGNHEYKTPDAAGYFGYFGAAANAAPVGNYSYDLGDWHIVVLNSSFIENQALGEQLSLAAQLAWLGADLAANPRACTLAMWHHPRFSSGGTHGSDSSFQPFWQVLYDAGADVVLSGHEHSYERFAPQTPDGTLDSARGIREFVVGTGGAGSYPFGTVVPNSEVRNVVHGVLKLTLSSTSYSWRFIPEAGSTFTDSGTTSCH